MKNYRLSIHTLGCKVNSYETAAMEAALPKERFTLVPFEEPADVVVIHTCSVTNIADRKSRQMLHRARTQNPEALVVAVGCYAQAAGEALLKDEAVDLIIGNEGKTRLPELILAALEGGERKKAYLTDIGKTRRFEEAPANSAEHTRAFVKIEDGCNQFCSYCLIPYLRGRVRSRQPEAVLEEVKRLLTEGYREIVLTGIHLSSYGLDLPGDAAGTGLYGQPLLSLMQQLDRLPGLERLRLGSLEPRIITEEFAGALKELKSFCPHFHLSLQSGCAATLKRMNRKYSPEEYAGKLELLRRVFDRPALTTDVIVGFPGETEEEFEETRAFLTQIRLFETHLFRYSRRRGTVADRMPEQLTEAVKARRSRCLQELGQANSRDFVLSFVGERREILVEEEVLLDGAAYLTGYTREYVKLLCPKADFPEAGSGDLITVPVTEAALADYLSGTHHQGEE